MTIEQLRLAQQARPFKPFDVCTADGYRISVPHPDFLWMPREASRTFVVYRDPEAYQVIDLLLVTALDFNNGRSGRGNGRRRRG